MRFVFFVLAGLAAFVAAPHAAGAAARKVVLTRLTERLYVAEDSFYVKENSLVYVGASSVTVVGATWTRQTARLLAAESAKITRKPIKAVIDTNDNLDRAGGNAYFKSIGARIVIAGANVTAYARTLRKLKALHLDIKTIVAGHWSPVHGPELIDQYLQMLAQYRR